MTTFRLKIIAITAMLIDHVGAIFVPEDTMLYLIMRCIGRLAFPIFAYLIVEGYFHTSNLKRYLTRLGIFALVSEIPFDLAFYRYHFHTSVNTDIYNALKSNDAFGTLFGNLFKFQNIFFTLFLGLLMISYMNKIEKHYEKKVFAMNVMNGLILLGYSAAAFLFQVDYSYLGIFLIAAFYLFRGSKPLMTFSIFVVLGFLLVNPILGLFASASMLFIGYYKGQKGKDAKYLFYIFYPAHLFILYLISSIL